MKYKCGHESNTVIMDDNILSLAGWMTWRDTVGFNGTKEQCFDCYCEGMK